MDLPVLRYVDVIVGVAVVVLLASTVVAAFTQVLFSWTFTRARFLRDALTGLIEQIDPKTLKPHASYIAERLLRHPLVARDNTIIGRLAWKRRAAHRRRRDKPPLPGLNPPDTIQREEMILLLLEWAGLDGPMHAQDRALEEQGHVSAAAAKKVAAAREALRSALRHTGIADPSAVASAVRTRMIVNECEHPEQPAQLWRSQAIRAVADTDFAGRLHAWYDNTMARATANYAYHAQVAASLVALALVSLTQLDSLNLIRRLAQDDKLRASLVAEAEFQIKRQQEAEGQPDLQAQARDAAERREQIAAALADLRDPKRGITPAYLVTRPVAQTRICQAWIPRRPGNAVLQIVAGSDLRRVTAPLDSPQTLDVLAARIRQSGAPVSVYPRGECLRLVAQDPDIDRIALFEPGAARPMSEETKTAIDWAGFLNRLPGVLLSWVLISLGAPFWYDLLKKLVGFRSILAKKDDEDREFRRNQQAGPAAKAGGADPPASPS